MGFLTRVSEFTNQPRPGWWDGYRHFLNFGLAALDKIDAWTGKIQPQDLTLNNGDLFYDLVERGQGGVLLASHLGNIEVCRAIGQSKVKVKLNVLVFTHHAESFNRMLKKISPDSELNLIQVTSLGPDIAIMLKQAIDNGEFVVIVGDRTSSTSFGRVVYSKFLGKDAPFSQGPFILASLMECPVLTMFCLKHKRGYQVYFDRLSEQLKLPRKERQQALQEVVDKYCHILQGYCTQFPYQWFNFYDFWLADNSSEMVK